jgi:hypothetical protein
MKFPFTGNGMTPPAKRAVFVDGVVLGPRVLKLHYSILPNVSG